MNWIAFIILAYLSIGLQSGLGAFIHIGLSSPNFGLLAVVFICINAPRRPALLASFALGAIQDLATQQPFGLFAFSYGVAAIVLTSVAQVVYREHPLTHFSCTLLAAALTGLLFLLHGRFHHAPLSISTTFFSAVYSAALAFFVIGALQKVRPLFAFRK